MSGNTPTLGGPSDPESSKAFTWSPTPIHPAPPGEWAANANVPQSSWGLECESDSEMEAEPHTTPKARPPPPPMQVPTASRTLTNRLDCSQASSPTPAPISRAASRIDKKGRPSCPYSTNVPAAAAAVTAVLLPPLPPPGPHGSSIFPSPEEYRDRQQSPPHPSPSNRPNHIITEGWGHILNLTIDDPEAAEALIKGAD